MIRTLAGQDWTTLRRDRTALAIFAILLAALLLAVLNGAAISAAHRAGLETQSAKIAAGQVGLTAPVSPTDVSRAVVLADGDLSVLSVGRTRLDPAHTEVSFFSRLDGMFRDYQTASPLALSAGAFDLGFVALIVAPLLIIALGYGILTSDRDSGRLRMILATSVRPDKLLFARVALRAALTIGPILLAATIATFLFSEADWQILFRLGLWIAAASAYLILWWALVSVANTFPVRAETAAIGLLALWAFWILVTPAVIGATAASIYPTPSRTDLTADLRRQEVVARAEAPKDLVRYMHDHPDLQARGGTYVASWMKNFAMTRMRVERHLEAPLAAFDAALARQRTITLAAEYATPALAVHRVMNDAAGTGEGRHSAFRAQARAFKEDVQGGLTDAALTGRELTLEQVAEIPEFKLAEVSIGALTARAIGPIAFWLAVAATLFAWAAIRVRRLGPD